MGVTDGYYYLGKIINPNGFNGKLNAYLDTDDPDYYINLKMVYLVLNESLVPYFIESIHLINNKATITFQDIDTLPKAEFLSKKEMYLPMNELPALTGKRFYYHEVIGFDIIDQQKGLLGKIEEILEYPNQAVFQIFIQEKEVLIPVNMDIIIKVNRKEKNIIIETPEGLVDIYLD